MKIIVTQSDIDNGERLKSCKCPIALAVSRAISADELPLVSVDGEGVAISGTGQWLNLPYVAVTFVDRFDQGYPVEPFEFELEGLKCPE